MKPPIVALQPLEPRALFSANHFSLDTLLAFSHLGSTWKYDRQYDDPKTQQGIIESLKVSVGPKTARYDGRDSDVVTEASKEIGKSSSAFSVDSHGTYLMLTSATGGSQIQLHNLRIAPKLMDLGTTYSFAGTFSGVLDFPINGKTLATKVDGKATSSIELIHRTSMKVPAGTFSVVEGKSTLKLTGEIQYSANGQKFKHPLILTESETFWAAPNIGEIADQSSEGIVIETDAEPIQSSFNSFSQLKSYTLT